MVLITVYIVLQMSQMQTTEGGWWIDGGEVGLLAVFGSPTIFKNTLWLNMAPHYHIYGGQQMAPLLSHLFLTPMNFKF